MASARHFLRRSAMRSFMIDPLGLDVRVCCRPIPGLAGGKHCYIESNTNNRRETWALNNIERPGWNYGEPRKNYPTDKGGDCTSWLPSDSCDDGRCFTEESNKWPRERYSYTAPFGPLSKGKNSNTFARCIWDKCRTSDYNSPEWESVLGPGSGASNAAGWLQPCPN